MMKSLFVMAVLVAVASTSDALPWGLRNLAPNPGFERGLSGWAKAGAAEFAVDTTVRHTGRASARISVRAGQQPQYQNLSFSLPVTPGQECFASFWVRCENVTGAGAYCALQFFRGDKRVAVQQTPFIQSGGWRWINIQAAVPYEAQRMQVTFLLHAQGTAWLDDVRVLLSRPQPRKVELALKPKTVISRDWLGFGAQGDMFLYRNPPPGREVTDADRELIRQRIRAMRPQIVRLIFTLNEWEPERGKPTPESDGMTDLRKTLAIFQEAGADIHLNDWGWMMPTWTRATARAPHPDERRAYADSFVAAVKYFREECGITNLKYVTLYNEPNLGAIPWEDYVVMYRCLDASLKAAGIREDVSVLGPDEAQSFEWTPKAIAELDDVIDCYDVHSYTANTGSELGRWVAQRTNAMPKTGAKGKRKPLMLTEFGMMDGMDTFGTPHNDEYQYGLFLADAAIASANEGASAALMWCLADWHVSWSPKMPMRWGLWKFRDANWEPRPGFYAWSLITRYTERGSSVHRVSCGATDAAATAFRAPGNGRWSILAVNRRPDSRPFVLSGLPAKSRWEPFVYARDKAPTTDRNMIRPSPIKRANAHGKLTGTMPPSSFTLWRQVTD